MLVEPSERPAAIGVEVALLLGQRFVELAEEAFGIEPGEIDLPTFPLFALFDPALGMTTIVPEIDPRRPADVDPAKIVQAIQQERVTNSFGSPTLWLNDSTYAPLLRTKRPWPAVYDITDDWLHENVPPREQRRRVLRERLPRAVAVSIGLAIADATLSIATTERWTSNGQPVERTDWHRITVLSQGLVKVLQAHAKKGQLVRVSGKLQHSRYEKDGVTRYATDVIVGNNGEFAILSAKRADATPVADAPTSAGVFGITRITRAPAGNAASSRARSGSSRVHCTPLLPRKFEMLAPSPAPTSSAAPRT